MSLIEKQCIGCGTYYPIPVDAAETSLYCTSTCKENHSLFSIAHVSQQTTEVSRNVGEND